VPSANTATSATSATSANSANSATNATNAETATQLASVTYVVAPASASVPAGGATFQFVPCPAGTVPTGGGMNSVTSDNLYIIASFASTAGGAFGHAGWGVRVGNKGAGAATFKGDAVCIKAAGTS
jgi:hypothetical protein